MPDAREGKIYYSFDEIKELTSKIVDTMADQRVSIDVIVAIAMGGWIPGLLLKRILSTKERPIPVYSVGIGNYDEQNNMLPFPVLYQPLPSNVLFQNRSVLLIDEVADSGKTFVKAQEHLLSFAPRQLYTAVLHHKELSMFAADFVGEHVGLEWIVYPWEEFTLQKSAP